MAHENISNQIDQMSLFWINNNIKLYNFVKSSPKDDFVDLYSNNFVNLALLSIYIMGFLPYSAIAFISWFERSGQAGPFRTLQNRLLSFTVDQVFLRYLTAGFIQNMRPFTGPINAKLCQSALFVDVFAGINIVLLTLSSNLARFTFVYFYKSMPPVNDDFIAFNIYSMIILMSFLVTSFKFYLGSTLSHVKVSITVVA